MKEREMKRPEKSCTLVSIDKKSNEKKHLKILKKKLKKKLKKNEGLHDRYKIY